MYPCHVLSKDAQATGLIDHKAYQWYMDLIEEAFGHYEALLIWSIPMSYWWLRETLIWIGTANKMFVTKRVFGSLWTRDVTLDRNITLL